MKKKPGAVVGPETLWLEEREVFKAGEKELARNFEWLPALLWEVPT